MRTVYLWALLLLAVASLFVGLSGYSMAASFSVADLERHEHWRAVAMWYLAAIGFGVAAGAAGAAVLIRRRRRERRAAP